MADELPSRQELGAAFRDLHGGEPFVIPNPWNVGSALVLEALGFKALATTSSGLAFTLGRPDGAASRDEVLGHVCALVAAVSVPVSVDLENGYGRAPEDAAAAIAAAAEAGAVGGSIEDWDPQANEIYGAEHAAERVAAASEAARRADFPFTLTARAENHLHGVDDLDDTIARLQAFERAGADVLYAPGLRHARQIRAVTQAVSKPVNVLAHAGLSMEEIAAAGARRVSVGGTLTWVAVEALVEAATRIRDSGDFSSLAGSPAQLGDWLSR